MRTFIFLAFAISVVGLIGASALSESDQMIQRTERPANIETPLDLIDRDGVFTQNDHFFTRSHLSIIPDIDPKTWKLELKGDSIKAPKSFSLDDLRHKFKQVEVVALAYCSGNRRGMVEPRVPGVQWQIGAMGNARWKGVRLSDILKDAGLKPDAVELVFNGADQPVLEKTPDYKKSLPVNKALDPDTLIAFEMNGKVLPQGQGFPARLVVPGWTATYWVKHLISIEAVAKPFDGFWMKTAYRVPKGKFAGDTFKSQDQPEKSPITSILVNSLITNLHEDQKIKRRESLELRGLAWDGGAGTQKVEISTDDGKTWRRARLEKDYGRYSWRRFHFSSAFSEPGEKFILARATNRIGQTQSSEWTQNPGGYHHNLVQRLKVVVE